MIIKIKIKYPQDIEKINYALAGSGYPIWIEEEKGMGLLKNPEYFVCFEYEVKK